MEKIKSPEPMNNTVLKKVNDVYFHSSFIGNKLESLNCPFVAAAGQNQMGQPAFLHEPCSSRCALFSLSNTTDPDLPENKTMYLTKYCGSAHCHKLQVI